MPYSVVIANHISLKDVTAKTLQLFKSIYLTAQVVAKVGASLSKALGVGRGVLEGDINSPIFFSVGLEEVFREADGVISQLGLSGGIKLRDTSYDKIGFADDVTATGTVIPHLSHRIQILELSSEKAGLHMYKLKCCTQHIGYYSDTPAITADDIEALKLKYECPKAWCTQRFASLVTVHSH